MQKNSNKLVGKTLVNKCLGQKGKFIFSVSAGCGIFLKFNYYY